MPTTPPSSPTTTAASAPKMAAAPGPPNNPAATRNPYSIPSPVATAAGAGCTYSQHQNRVQLLLTARIRTKSDSHLQPTQHHVVILSAAKNLSCPFTKLTGHPPCQPYQPVS